MGKKNNFKELYQREVERFETFQSEEIRARLWHTTSNYKFMGEMVDLYVSKFFEVFVTVNADMISGLNDRVRQMNTVEAEAVEDLRLPFEKELHQRIRRLRDLIAEGHLEHALDHTLALFRNPALAVAYPGALPLYEQHSRFLSETGRMDRTKLESVLLQITDALLRIID